jgi:HD-GYP domain-containing protein (c-di-GMP phosphodiesterase class II)
MNDFEARTTGERLVASTLRVAETLATDPRFCDWRVGAKSPHRIEATRGDRVLLFLGLEPALRDPSLLDECFETLAAVPGLLFLVGDPPAQTPDLLARGVYDFVPADAPPERLLVLVRNAWERLEADARAESRGKLLRRYKYELGELIEIARGLTSERDTSRLLGMILEKSRFITGADAGSIYVVEGAEAEIEKRTLHFRLSQNDSVAFPSADFRMRISRRSIAGACAIAKQFINIPDVYALDGTGFTFDRSFDEKTGYRTKSMLTVPLVNRGGEVIGVIQLINKKRDPARKLATKEDVEANVVPFDERSEELLSTLGAQAGISLETAMLYEEIQTIFEGFVRASVHAIEQRDPTTSGHSLRVSVLSRALAEVVDRADGGPYADTRFSREELRELEWAAMLHDFGKVGVREQVLVKAKKLYGHDLDLVRARLQFAKKTVEADLLSRKMDAIRRGASAGEIDEIHAEGTERLALYDEAWAVIVETNEPTVLKSADFERLERISKMTYVDFEGAQKPILTESELLCLRIQRGSLTAEEIEEIRSHVVHTYNFLSKIPWGRTFARVPEIAGAHHERVNGTGYPSQLSAPAIPVQSKIMSVADIFDALTASDRPYKKAVPVNRALDILGYEVKDQHLDGELVKLFVESQAFKVVEGNLTY